MSILGDYPKGCLRIGGRQIDIVIQSWWRHTSNGDMKEWSGTALLLYLDDPAFLLDIFLKEQAEEGQLSVLLSDGQILTGKVILTGFDMSHSLGSSLVSFEGCGPLTEYKERDTE